MERIVCSGVVKWFNGKKGYGFITGQDGKEYFVHYSKISGNGFRNLAEGQAVKFNVETTPKGPQAVDVEQM